MLSSISGSTLMPEDKAGDTIAFALQDDAVREVPIPSPSPPEVVKEYLKHFHALVPKPELKTFDDVTRWWVKHPNPLSYQQALCLSDELYRRFLARPMLREEDCCRLAVSGLVTEEEYQDIQLWFLDEGKNYCWLGPLGVDGTGNIYGLAIHYGKAYVRRLKFYLPDDYYHCMNHMV